MVHGDLHKVWTLIAIQLVCGDLHKVWTLIAIRNSAVFNVADIKQVEPQNNPQNLNNLKQVEPQK